MRIKCHTCKTFVSYSGIENYCSNCGRRNEGNSLGFKLDAYKRFARIYGTITVIGMFLSFIIPPIVLGVDPGRYSDSMTGYVAGALALWVTLMTIIFEVHYKKRFPDLRRN